MEQEANKQISAKQEKVRKAIWEVNKAIPEEIFSGRKDQNCTGRAAGRGKHLGIMPAGRNRAIGLLQVPLILKRLSSNYPPNDKADNSPSAKVIFAIFFLRNSSEITLG